MRRGRVFRKCRACSAEAGAGRHCQRCGSTSITWAYRVDVSGPGEKRRQRLRSGFASKALALAALNAEQVERSEGRFLEPSKVTVAEFLDHWLASGADGVRGSTLKGYEVCVRLHISPRIGSVPLQALSRTHVRSLYEQLATDGYAKGQPSPDHLELLNHVADRYRVFAQSAGRSAVRRLTAEFDRPEATIRHWLKRCRELGLLDDRADRAKETRTALSPKAVHNVHVCLRRALEAARADGLIKTNPAGGAHRAPRDAPEMLTWSEDELRTFLDFVSRERDHALWRLAAETGMRRGELVALRRRDLDLNRRVLHVRQQWSRQRDGRLVFGPPKTKKAIRTIELGASAVEVLRAHLEAQEFERRGWGNAYHHGLDLVFCRPDGSAYDPDGLTHRFDRLVMAAGLRPIRLHDLRHTNATLLLADGEDVKTVSERLGHASINTTLAIYHHVIPRKRASAASRIGSLLDQRGPEADHQTPVADALDEG